MVVVDGEKSISTVSVEVENRAVTFDRYIEKYETPLIIIF